MHFLALGYGYTAQALGESLVSKGWDVVGTTRNINSETPNILQFRGMEDFPALQDVLESATHILVSTPPSSDGTSIAPFFEGIPLPHLRWLGYLSSTSVYGDHQGAWVDETSECHPSSESGVLRLEEEKRWLSLYETSGLPVHIFRLSGIYGPGRNYFSALKDGTQRRIFKGGTVFSRIHVSDIVQTLQASISRPTPGEIYNLADDEPAPPWEVIAYAAQLLGQEPPPLISYEDAAISPTLKAFYQDSKRVSNKKIKNYLGVTLSFPTYREGLEDIFKIIPQDQIKPL